MATQPSETSGYGFGAFELDVDAATLRKHGSRIRLQQKPFEALKLLLEKPGMLVTREELRVQLWDAETFVEFDDSLNHVIKRLRDVLSDSADEPRFIETVAGQGYRFIARVEPIAGAKLLADNSNERHEFESASEPLARDPVSRPNWRERVAVPALVLVVASVAYWFLGTPSTTVEGVSELKKPVIAVLPLADLSEDKSQAYIAPAMTDELIARLARIGGLQVISRTSTARFENSDDYSMPSMPELARELGATHVVEGNVTRAGNRIRITAQLIDASLDRHVWVGTYTRDLDDIIELQSQVALDIAREIQVELTPQEEVRLAAAYSVRPEVYEAYLEARSLFEAGHMAEAIEAFQQVIELDPDFAPAYSWLADSYIVFGWWRGPPVDLLPKAKLVALKARELDDSLADPHLLLAKIRAFFEWEWADAEQHYQRAIEVSPSYAKAYLGYGVYLAVLGRRQEAIEMARRAVELDPASASTLGTAGDIYYFTDNNAKALSHYRTASVFQPDGALWYAMQGCVYTDMGEYEKADR